MSDGVRVCGVPDHFGTSGLCKWPDGDIPWTIVSVIPGFTLDAMKAAATEAFGRLAAVCNIKPRWVDAARDARIYMGAATLDGPLNVLADSVMPCGQTAQCQQRYDKDERWVIDDGVASGKIDLVRVMCHELMHAIGVPHLAAGSPNLIAPTYSTSINRPQAGDIAELQKRYGKPVSTPTPTNPTVPTTPTLPGGLLMNLTQLVDLIGKIGPLLQLFQDPAFQKLLQTLVTLFGGKQSLTADDIEALQAELGNHVQQMRA